MKKIKFMVVLLLVVAFAAVSFVGCSAPAAASSAPAAASSAAAASVAPAASSAAPAASVAAASSGKQITIGYAVYWMSDFATLMTAAIQDQAKKDGVNLITMDAKNDPATQLTQVDNLINQKVDALLVAAVDVGSMVQGVEAANKAKIPFVGVNMRIPTAGTDAVCDAYSGPNDVQAGEMMVNYAISKLGTSFNCIVLEGANGYSATTDRDQGIKNVLDKNPGIKVLAQKTANWTREGALQLTENYIQSFGNKIQAVICHNDEEAMGAVQALQAANMKTKVIVTGIDAIEDSCKSIKAGIQDYTVFQDPVLEGVNGLKFAETVATGGTVTPKEQYIEMIGVTKDNVDTYLAKFADKGVASASASK